MRLHAWPRRAQENDNGNPATGQILLMLEVLVGCDPHFEPRCFCRSQQRSILNLRPTPAAARFNRMSRQMSLQWERNALVEQDLHGDAVRRSLAAWSSACFACSRE